MCRQKDRLWYKKCNQVVKQEGFSYLFNGRQEKKGKMNCRYFCYGDVMRFLFLFFCCVHRHDRFSMRMPRHRKSSAEEINMKVIRKDVKRKRKRKGIRLKIFKRKIDLQSINNIIFMFVDAPRICCLPQKQEKHTLCSWNQIKYRNEWNFIDFGRDYESKLFI